MKKAAGISDGNSDARKLASSQASYELYPRGARCTVSFFGTHDDAAMEVLGDEMGARRGRSRLYVLDANRVVLAVWGDEVTKAAAQIAFDKAEALFPVKDRLRRCADLLWPLSATQGAAL